MESHKMLQVNRVGAAAMLCVVALVVGLSLSGAHSEAHLAAASNQVDRSSGQRDVVLPQASLGLEVDPSVGGARQPIAAPTIDPGVQGLRLSIQSSLDGHFLESAEVLVTGPGGVIDGRYISSPSVAGTTHVATLIPQSVFVDSREQMLEVSASNHCTQTIPWLAGMVEEEVTLDAAASLTVRVIDEAGTPLEGVPISLLETFGGMEGGRDRISAPVRLRDELVRQSDSKGEATWIGLTTDSSYRWTALDGSVARFDPPTIHRDTRNADGSIGIEVGDQEAKASGPMKLEPLEHRRVTGIMARRSSLTGTLADAALEAPLRAVVKVFHCSSDEVNAARGYGSTELEAVGHSDQEGRFRFEGLRPGKKVFRANWREAGHHVYFANASFNMGMGESLDIGEVSRLRGSTLQIETELRTQAGRTIPLADEGDDHQQIFFSLGILSRDHARRQDSALQELLAVGLGESLWLHGLREGECRLDLNAARGGGGRQGWTMPEPRKVELPGTAHVSLAVIVADPLDVQLVAHFPMGVAAESCGVQVMPLEGRGATHTGRLEVTEAGQASGSMRLDEGRYQVLIRSHEGDPDVAGAGVTWVGRTEFHVQARGVPIEVELTPGASVLGQVAVSAQSSPNADHFALGIRSASAIGRVQWSHPRVELAPDGQFKASGLIPSASYVTEQGLTFTTGPAGSVQSIQLEGH